MLLGWEGPLTENARPLGNFGKSRRVAIEGPLLPAVGVTSFDSSVGNWSTFDGRVVGSNSDGGPKPDWHC